MDLLDDPYPGPRQLEFFPLGSILERENRIYRVRRWRNARLTRAPSRSYFGMHTRACASRVTNEDEVCIHAEK